MQFEIRNNVPKPEVTSKVGRKSNYPFAQMVLGQSFVVTYTTTDKEDRQKARRNLQVAVKNFNEKHENLETVLSVAPLEDETGVGVWCEAKSVEA